MDHFYRNGHRLSVQFLFLKTSKFKTSVVPVPYNKLLTNLAALSLRGGAAVHRLRPVPRIFCLQGQTPQTFTGISRIQTGFLVKHYVRKKKQFSWWGQLPPLPLPLPLCTALRLRATLGNIGTCLVLQATLGQYSPEV